jgi:prevent-host-death family protein
MPVNATELRRDVYKIIDRVLDSGQAVEVTRKGRRVRIVPVEDGDRFARLRPLTDLIVGNPEELVHIDWSNEWKP